VLFISNPFLWNNPVHEFSHMIKRRFDIISQQQIDWSKLALLSLSDRLSLVNYRIFASNSYFGTFKSGFLNKASLIIGLFFIVLRLKNYRSIYLIKTNRNILAILLFWVCFLMFCTTLFIPLDFNRYYLLIVVSVIFIQSYGIYSIISLIYFFIRNLLITKFQD
jgi:hypothetical protein